ncbi:outer membrane protein assembly factor BamB family protein [Actinoplanes sp. HUAS TT8]|uniref:outer membrane protein assembly factor BamB family protein n=1 Tax=Actinoplanes sp. HUAS TT8 TaxID=3447453 RepID=UPI003F51D46D
MLLLLATVLVGWRILKPAEVLATAKTPYPPLVVSNRGVVARLNVAPLIIQDRMRVYAAKHQVRADEPVYSRGVNTTRWSLRRWPAQLSGVVAQETTVVTRWTDGAVVALDGRTGNIAWRAQGPDGIDYNGHRTGATTVWRPTGLFTAAGTVVVSDDKQAIAYDVSTGAQRWQATLPAGCVDGFTTSGGAYVCATGAFAVDTGKPVPGWPTGPFVPLGCDVGRSGCGGLRDAKNQGWMTTKAAASRAVALDRAGSTVANGVVVSPGGGLVTAYRPDGKTLWTWTGSAKVLGTVTGRVLLVTPRRKLVVLNSATGELVYQFGLMFRREDNDWDIGRVQVSEHYLAIERLRKGGEKDADSPLYYYSTDTVLLTAL